MKIRVSFYQNDLALDAIDDFLTWIDGKREHALAS